MLNLDWSIIWNIVNILVLFLLLKHFLFGPITKMMESRTAEIENNLKDAEEKNRKAEALGAEYEKQLADAQAEAAKLVQEAKERGQKEYDEILKNADQDARTAAARAVYARRTRAALWACACETWTTFASSPSLRRSRRA